MSEFDDITEINLAADRGGSAKLSRSAYKAAQRLLARIHRRPKWRKQLATLRGHAGRAKRTQGESS